MKSQDAHRRATYVLGSRHRRRKLADPNLLRAIVPYLILGLVWALVVAAYAPGQVNGDTLAQIQQIETDFYNDWFAPLLDAMWSIPYNLGLELVVVLVLQVGALLSGLYLLARAFLPRLGASLAASFVLLTPPVLGQVGLLGRDVWFVALMVLAAGCLTRAGARGRAGLAWLVLFAVAVLLGTAARQNALPMTLLLLGAGGVIAMARLGRPRGGARRKLLAGLAIGVVGTLGLVGVLRLSYSALDVYPLHPQQMTFTWDLSSLSVREERVLFPRTIYPAQDLGTLKREFDPDSLWSLILPPENPHLKLTTTGTPLTDARYHALRDAWWSAITSHPGEYAVGRAELWLRLINVTRAPANVAHFDWTGDNEGYGYWNPGLLEVVHDYMALFTSPGTELGRIDRFERGGILFVVAFYLVVALALGVVLLRRALREAKWALLAPAALLLGAVLYELVLAVSLPGARYRWSYPLVVGTLGIAVPAGVALARKAFERRVMTRVQRRSTGMPA